MCCISVLHKWPLTLLLGEHHHSGKLRPLTSYLRSTAIDFLVSHPNPHPNTAVGSPPLHMVLGYRWFLVLLKKTFTCFFVLRWFKEKRELGCLLGVLKGGILICFLASATPSPWLGAWHLLGIPQTFAECFLIMQNLLYKEELHSWRFGIYQ